MDDVRRASLEDTKKVTRRVGRGLGKVSGVLLPGVTAPFLPKDAFGHNNRNCAIVHKFFG